ncbi:MAG: hypothetical protein WA156_10375, partial [Methylocystis silviterrae]
GQEFAFCWALLQLVESSMETFVLYAQNQFDLRYSTRLQKPPFASMLQQQRSAISFLRIDWP